MLSPSRILNPNATPLLLGYPWSTSLLLSSCRHFWVCSRLTGPHHHDSEHWMDQMLKIKLPHYSLQNLSYSRPYSVPKSTLDVFPLLLQLFQCTLLFYILQIHLWRIIGLLFGVCIPENDWEEVCRYFQWIWSRSWPVARSRCRWWTWRPGVSIPTLRGELWEGSWEVCHLLLGLVQLGWCTLFASAQSWASRSLHGCPLSHGHVGNFSAFLKF